MKSIGKAIKEVRQAKKISFNQLEEATKIKKEFLKAIEKENWTNLPSLSVVTGFVKSITHALEVDEGRLTALLRRDYPPKKVTINPKPDVSNRFTWSPKITFIAGILVVGVVVLGYLGFQYLKFTSAPSLEIFSPKQGEVVTTDKVNVSGQTDIDAVVSINNQPVVLDEDGKFNTEVKIFQGTQEIKVEATSRSGKSTIVSRKIVPNLE